MAPSSQAAPHANLSSLNALTRDAFAAKFLPALPLTPHTDITLTFETSTSLSAPDLEACFALIEHTSGAAYKASTRGWSPADKRAEMREADMRYLLVRLPNTADARIAGFLSFQLTEEDDMDVVYCYEIHLQESLRGRGIGALLMREMERVGAAAGMQQAMLTVFTANAAAIAFYGRLGYEYYDEEPVAAPKKRLRSGKTERAKPSYVILAKAL